ncbi:Extracellular basic protease precursor [Pseudobythopirellula maris]|uniref:Extracellular basic protease n=1 Tax=Pseudobythopirellula maris TaxID=2527991 RepID=A0A5C5ZU20_9BACT|nr:GEVED domain-containing protein [Pseudobythopirellula maris]TWT90696.1 Extracellular basic protease precursor [Pseudobythopirellula maris]
MSKNRKSRSGASRFSPLLGGKTTQARKAPRRRAKSRNVERLEERQMLAADFIPNDPYFSDQWHLRADGQLVLQPDSDVYLDTFAVPGEDINVTGAWGQGVDGSGIQIAIISGGFALSHEDIAANIRTDLQIDLLAGGTPAYSDPTDVNGTALAGLAAAVGNNGIGGVGVAFGADIIPIRMIPGQLDGVAFDFTSPDNVTVANDAYRYLAGIPLDTDGDQVIDAIVAQDMTDIYLHGYLIEDVSGNFDGSADRMDPELIEAIRETARLGRSVWLDVDGDGFVDEGEYRSLGSIHVVGSGDNNGPDYVDAFESLGNFESSQYDQLANSIYTITVGGVDHGGDYENPESGSISPVWETGSNVLLVAPVGSRSTLNVEGEIGQGSGLVTTDLPGEDGSNVLPFVNDEYDNDYFIDTDYMSNYSSTTAAAAQVAGAIALMLDANPNLSRRDVEKILLMSARQNDQFSTTWVTNPFRAFVDPDFDIPLYHYYDIDLDGDGEADIEDAVLPNLEGFDPFFEGDVDDLYTTPEGDVALPVDGDDTNYPFLPAYKAIFANIPDFDLPAVLSPTIVVDEDGEFIDPDGNAGVPGTSYYVFPYIDISAIQTGEGEGDPPVPIFPTILSSSGSSAVTIPVDPLFVFQGLFDDDVDSGGGFFLTFPENELSVPLNFENGAGFTVSYGYGQQLEETGYAHGVLDVNLAVELALAWDVFDQYVDDTKTLTSGVLGGNGSVFRVQPRAFADLDPDGEIQMIIPGGLNGGNINTGFYNQFSEPYAFEIIEDNDGNEIGSVITGAPFYNPNGDVNLNSGRGLPSLPLEFDPSITTDFLSVEWVEVTLQIASGDIEHLNISLVSPDGTQSVLSPYRLQPGDGGAPFVFQTPQGDEGAAIPGDDVIDDFIVTGEGLGFLNDPTGQSPFQQVGGIDFGGATPVAGGEFWTFTTNRHFAELFATEQAANWQLVFENWGDGAVTFESNLQVKIHGTEVSGTRIQGKVGVDDNAQGIEGSDHLAMIGAGVDNDENFNFERHIELGEVLVTTDIGTTITQTVVLDDAFDSVHYDSGIYQSRLPDTGEEFAYPVVDRDAYMNQDSAAMIGSVQTFIQETTGLPTSITAVDVSLLTTNGESITYQNFDYSQESFASNVTVAATQFEVEYDATGNAISRTPTGKVQYFTTGADGNYYFDVESTPLPPDPVDQPGAYWEWFSDFGKTLEYEISIDTSQDASLEDRIIARSYASTQDVLESGFSSFEYDSLQKQYSVSVFSGDAQLFGGDPASLGFTSVVKELNFLLEIDPAATLVDVSGVVISDFDGNGAANSFDTALEGVTVYYDANENGVLDVGESTGVTDENGAYTLSLSIPGEQDVTIRVVEADVESALGESFSYVAPLSGAVTTLTDQGDAISASFYVQPDSGVGAIIDGSIYEDVNDNQTQDSNETAPGLSFRVYIDANGNQSYDAGEVSTMTDANGQFRLNPAGGSTYTVRVDLSGAEYRQTTPDNGAGVAVTINAGEATDGVTFGLFDQRTQDFGDLIYDPASGKRYPTTLANNGARHTVVPGIFLGSGVDTEVDGIQSTDATGDNLNGANDEDGVVLVSPRILPNSTVTFDITATGLSASLNAWIDFNNDGDWDDPGERIADDMFLVSGETNRVSFATPSSVNISASHLAARFRWGNFGLGYTGAASTGEVEDYMLATSQVVTVSGHVNLDFNNNSAYDAATDSPFTNVRVYHDANNNGQFDFGERSDTTNANGQYVFSITPTGTSTNARIRIDESTLPGDYTYKSPSSGMFESTVLPGSTVGGRFLIRPTGGLPGSLTGTVFYDIDGDGLQDPGELGRSGVAVQLYGADDADGLYNDLKLTAITDADGNYTFNPTQNNTYQVALNLSETTLIQSSPIGARTVVVQDGTTTTVGLFGVDDAPTGGGAVGTQDYGDLFVDATHNYPTLPANNGARHTVVPGIYLGGGVDTDSGTLTSTDATADDIAGTDDEDGVTLLSDSVVRNSTIDIQITATGAASSSLNAWIDFNNDGDWDDPGEQIADDMSLLNGTHTYVFATPSGVGSVAADAMIAARFRWGNFGLSYTGSATAGEVEDYYFDTDLSTMGSAGPIRGDYNGDGAVDRADYDEWVSTYGSATQLQADGNLDGEVNGADFTVWRDAKEVYDAQQAAAALAAANAVAPEPMAAESVSAPVVEPIVTVVDSGPIEEFADDEPVVAAAVFGPGVYYHNDPQASTFAGGGAAVETTPDAELLDSALLEWSIDADGEEDEDDSAATFDESEGEELTESALALALGDEEDSLF